MGPSPTIFVPWPFVFGTDGNDTLVLNEDHSPTLFAELGAGEDTVEGTIALLGNFDIDTGSGDDYIEILSSAYSPTNPNSSATATAAGHLVIDTGAGNDAIYYTGQFSTGPVWLDGGDGDDYIEVNLAPPPVPYPTIGHVDINAGAGDDQVYLEYKLQNVLVSSYDVSGHTEINLGDGNDGLYFVIEVEHQTGDDDDDDPVIFESLSLNFTKIEAGAGEDEIFLSGPLGGRVDVDAGDDDDYICASFSFAESLAPASFYDVKGGGGDDTIEISGSFLLPEPDDEVLAAGGSPFISWYSAGMRVDGGDGDDDISVKPLLIVAEDVEGEALATLVVNKLRGGLMVEGGDGNDTLNVFAEASDDLGLEVAFHLRGDAGMDTFVVSQGQETVIIDDFTPGEDTLQVVDLLAGEVEVKLFSEPGQESTAVYDTSGGDGPLLLAIMPGLEPDDLGAGDIVFGPYA